MFFWGIVCKTKRKTSPAGPSILAPPSAGRGSGPAGGLWGDGGQEGRAAAAATGLRWICPFPRKDEWHSLPSSLLPSSTPHGGLHLGSDCMFALPTPWTGISYSRRRGSHIFASRVRGTEPG